MTNKSNTPKREVVKNPLAPVLPGHLPEKSHPKSKPAPGTAEWIKRKKSGK